MSLRWLTYERRKDGRLMAANFSNRSLFVGDNLPILRGFNDECVDLIYLDPPFNSKRQWSAPVGSRAAGAEFKDTWTLSDVDQIWHDQLRDQNPGLHDVVLGGRASGGPGRMSYLIYMAVRLLELRRVLKPSGALFLHCDPTESHSLKLLLDVIMGEEGFKFQNEIVWRRTSAANTGAGLRRMTDSIFFYAGSGFKANPVFRRRSRAELERHFPRVDESGRRWRTEQVVGNPARQLPGNNYVYKDFRPDLGWCVSEETLKSLDRRGRLYWSSNGVPYRISYADDFEGARVGSLWADIPVIQGAEKLGFPTQKPVALLERVLKLASNPGDLVLDPFAGCATACIAAECLGRKWAGIDISPKAADLIDLRMREQLGLPASLAVHWDVAQDGLPRRSDLGRLPPPRTHLKRLYGEQQGVCRGCGHHFEARHLEVDHVVPRAKGGSDHVANLQLLCGSCNRRKGAGSMSRLTARILQDRGIPV